MVSGLSYFLSRRVDYFAKVEETITNCLCYQDSMSAYFLYIRAKSGVVVLMVF